MTNLELMRMKNAADNGRALVLMLFALNLVAGSTFLAMTAAFIMGLAFLADAIQRENNTPGAIGLVVLTMTVLLASVTFLNIGGVI